MPEISVIVPVYKVEPYIHRCVDSILGQSFSDFELILVDDGSPDNCGRICEEYAMQDPRIHVIHQANGGLSAARNAGIDWVLANSNSQWLTFIDSDDWIHREYLRIMYDAVQAEHCANVMCELLPTDHFVMDAEVSHCKTAYYSAEDAYVQHYWLCMHACARLLHRGLLERVRFPQGKLFEDAHVTHLLLFQESRVAICNVALYYQYENPDSITRVQWSERKLDQISGHEKRLSYLREHGYDRAFDRELKTYTWMLCSQVQSLRELGRKDSAYSKYLKVLQPKMVEAFREAKKRKAIPYRENVWIYEVVYPIKPFWVLRNLFVKLFPEAIE